MALTRLVDVGTIVATKFYRYFWFTVIYDISMVTVTMKLVALNKERAVYLPEGDAREIDPRIALNKLLTVHSWKAMLDFLGNEACCSLFAKREDDPFKNGLWKPGELHVDLAGSLESRIDADSEVDYLDELAEKDLLATGKDEIYEVWIPELLYYRDNYARYLTIAAYALGATPPEGTFKFPEVSEALDKEYIKNFLGDPSKYAAVALDDMKTHKQCGTYFDCISEDSIFENFGRYPDGVNEEGYLLTTYEEWPENPADSLDSTYYFLIVYERERYTRKEAIRLLCGELVTVDLGMPAYLDPGDFYHYYTDEPDIEINSLFSLDQGFFRPKDDGGFTHWQTALFDCVESAIFDGRVTLCPVCGTPILTRSNQSRAEYCCESHKTAASKRRRQTAHILYASGTPLEEAVAQIGNEYRASIERWYAEAEQIAHPAP